MNIFFEKNNACIVKTIDGGSEGDRTPVQKQTDYSLYTLSKSENFI